MRKNADLKKVFIVAMKNALIAGVFALICFSGIYRCPIKLIFGINCPGCGMTRAFSAALRLDFKTAFQFHPLFWLFGIETAYVVFHKPLSMLFSLNKKAELAVGILSLLLLLIVWIVRQFVI